MTRQVFTYANGRQKFNLPEFYQSRVTYHAWGGGGGGGSDTSAFPGGNGSAGSYVTGTFLANPGDEIEVAVGGGGAAGLVSNTTKRISSVNIPGLSASSRANTGAFGLVPNPTGEQYYPAYSNTITPRSSDAWGTFMNTYAVWTSDSQSPGTVQWSNDIWFPETGDYQFTVAADNIGRFFLDDVSIITIRNNFRTSGETFTVSVTKGQHVLRIQGTNSPGDASNPAGVACVITRSPPAAFNNGGMTPAIRRNLVWHTRLGRSVDLSSQVPIRAAPLVPFYQPRTGNYGWGDFGNTCMAILAVDNDWTDAELARFNLSRDQCITAAQAVSVKCTGRADDAFVTGYYSFRRGQSWDAARYDWLGSYNIAAIPVGDNTPSCWVHRSSFNHKPNGRSPADTELAAWTVDPPPRDGLYIVGFIDGASRTANIPRGSNDLSWTVNWVTGPDFVGGAGGASATNQGADRLNFYGGTGGTVGSGGIAGGGGGGGGASLVMLRPRSSTETAQTIALAGGGGGGGGSGATSAGSDATALHQAAQRYNNTVGAGQSPAANSNTGGGGGGGGGGSRGGRSGVSASVSPGGSRGGSGAAAGSSKTGQNIVPTGSGAYPAGINVAGYVTGSALGGHARSQAVYPVTATAYPLFLNQHGVWEQDAAAPIFERSYQVLFPTTANYTFTCYVDNGAQVFVDDGIVLDLTPPDRGNNARYWFTNGATVTRTITQGLHKISWSASNISVIGSFGLTVTEAGSPNQYVFDSRRPPSQATTAAGGSGLVILEIEPIQDAIQVKLDGSYRPVSDFYTKVAGSWRDVTASWIKVNGTWRSISGTPASISVTVDSTNFGAPPQT